MGRPEKQIAHTDNPGLRYLAVWLRRIRMDAGLTYAELAALTGQACSAATLQRAASGERVPRLPVVEAYAVACGATPQKARRYWRDARSFEPDALLVSGQAPRPRMVENAAELRAALRATYYKAGAMPLRELERRAGNGRLPRTTMRRMLNGASMLSDEQLRIFLTVCDVPEREHQDWLDAWSRVWKKNQHWYDAELMKSVSQELAKEIARERSVAHELDDHDTERWRLLQSKELRRPVRPKPLHSRLRTLPLRRTAI